MIGLQFSEITEVALVSFSDCPLAKSLEGKSFDKPASEYDKPLGKIDDSGKEYMDNKGLLPDTSYTLNGNKYETDETGRIVSCEAAPKQTPENSRDNVAQTSVGGENRRLGDQGGHIVGRDLGGDGGLGNLVSMDSRINQSDYKRMENDIKKTLNNTDDVKVKTTFEYLGDSKRPDKITSTVTAEGKDTVYTFDNNLDGSLMDKLKESCNELDVKTVQDVLDKTGGQISSTKEEYDTAGNLIKTTVAITYKNDEGKNLRTSVEIKNDGGASR